MNLRIFHFFTKISLVCVFDSSPYSTQVLNHLV